MKSSKPSPPHSWQKPPRRHLGNIKIREKKHIQNFNGRIFWHTGREKERFEDQAIVDSFLGLLFHREIKSGFWFLSLKGVFINSGRQ
ncbi:hypothetical protein TorRG33x02_190580 [Trema orientale]|uniref:Uncharacterized protein n=1 Tax=Trema orientale TaxID=63057 RepID=A0A2P5EI73_TREOI|nr:hypothetical protein TorRG33x02_190580 [Trema orientale]